MKKTILTLPILVILLSSFTENVGTKLFYTIGGIIGTGIYNTYESQTYLTQAQADLLYKPISYTPQILDILTGYSLTIDANGVYGYSLALPPVDYNRDVQSKPNFASVAFSGSYYDLGYTPQIPVLAYGLHNNSNEYSVDTSIIMYTSKANSAITNINSNLATKAPMNTSITISTGTWSATHNLGSSFTYSLPTIPTNNNQLTNGMNFLINEVDGSITNEIELPSQTSQSGKYLSTNGSSTVWNTLPSQTTQTLTGANGITINTAANSFTVSKTKRQETYSGTTDGSGNYTVSFGTSYSSAPNIQANPIGGSTEIFLKIVSVSTTGFTVNVFQRANVLSLALSTATSPVSGANVDVLVTEK